ncbi:DEAD/DEAH box helicase [Planococcus halotolerans]|uniref:Helicase n=1 Tax=Planococcus halotolerans TaxID=2233542 RepID=A0A365KKC4_9BACL|nr:type ISP restriction/modification enzyme [Planococcus halotolerans]RAZ73506.1 helicase [Planococcus halotolerans]
MSTDVTARKGIRSFIELLKEIDVIPHTQRDRGTLFELLVAAYFENEPMYARLFDRVWKLSDVPAEYKIPKKDTGVDLVARKHETGELVAIQCKFYSEDTIIQKLHIDSFLNEVGKQYYAEGIVITTTDKWSANADDALKFRDKTIARISLADLRESKIDWSSFSFSNPKAVQLQEKKTPRSHQIPAIDAVMEGFKAADRGKLIMAPGTGKTYTSMAIAEKMAMEKKGVFRVLYLVPSIQLLSQTLRSWTADTNYNMDAIAVCSDRKVTKADSNNELEDIAAADLGYPATTNQEKLLFYKEQIESSDSPGNFLTVFSTYQSIDVVSEAQKNGFYEFDLVICDEAHRTTGATESGKEASAFTKVHSDNNIKTARRLYQTATPRVYGEDARKKAEEMSVLIADMSDSSTYGEEFYRIGFGDAIRKDILTDYKVMVLAVDEEVIARRFQQLLARESELEFDDVTKIIGCWNGLVKRKSNSDETLGAPMKRAIAFTGTIKDSKLITNMFSTVVDEYINEVSDQTDQFSVEIDHADGSMNALQKNEKISWLKSEVPDQTCRILSNARFLTEGVDVPDLDAVMFLKPRKSKIDIAQAVGRVMRKVEGKDYGYVILPIGIPAGLDPNTVLDNHEKYRVVWEVLNALRSLDERFDATINQLELNKKKPGQIQVIGVGDAPEDGLVIPKSETEQLSFSLTEEDWSDLERAIYGKIVRKVGNVRYWEDWSRDVAEIARQHMIRIRIMVEDKTTIEYMEFQKFVTSLRHNINDSISDEQAIEMLAQHLITKPVFEALFESYSFVHNNPVSKSMDSILKILDEQGLVKEQEKLEGFYESVRIRAQGIDNLKAKQDIIIQLYDKFFKVGFKETTERLGIVFTPVEVVDFIIHSVDNILQRHFSKSLASEGVHVLDPFTGTGTFITRLLQSGLISKEDLLRKYTQEIHANEIVLLSYYIAAINIEETFHSLYEGEYVPFEGIVLTDTFESTETKDSFISELFDENNKRLKKQQENPIFAILGNPPYSAGAKSDNDNQTNISYPILDDTIEKTYAKYTKAKMKKSLYDSYIRAFRWASDRIADKGVIGFVSNGSFIDGQTTDGLRKSWYEEFNYIYVFNLRGDQRTIGEKSRQEGGKIFGSGSRTPIAITILVKDGSDDHKVLYHDIGDYLSREQKLDVLKTSQSINAIDWTTIIPDANNDWINQRDENYGTFIPLYDKENSIFKTKLTGINTSRDSWCYGFSKEKVNKNIEYMVENYNFEVTRLAKFKNIQEKEKNINLSPNFVNWSRSLRAKLLKSQKIELHGKLVLSRYRPFVKKWLYYDKNIVEMPGQFNKFLGEENLLILIPGPGGNKKFSPLISDSYADFASLGFASKVQCYFKNNYENKDSLLLDGDNSNFTEFALKYFSLSEEELFYYIYALFHSKEYITKYDSDLKKSTPQIPNLKNKFEFVEIGRKLADLHLNYEAVPPYKGVKIQGKSNPSYKVVKMKNPKKGVTDTIVFNEDITILNIPEKAYEYVINGRSAIDWIIDQYRVKVDKSSGITDNPNEYSEDEKYIFNLLLSVINVSVQTVDIVNSIPPLEFEN